MEKLRYNQYHQCENLQNWGIEPTRMKVGDIIYQHSATKSQKIGY